jgi:hypothetical protein
VEAQAPLDLLVASRPSSLRMAMGLGCRSQHATHRCRRICFESHVIPSPNGTDDAVSNKNQWFVVAVLVALLVPAFWYCVTIWRATSSMPVYGNIILGGAVVLALVAGCGLIALMYHSQRKGHDEPARSDGKTRE